MKVTIRPREEGDQQILDGLFKDPEVSAELCMPWNAESWISESRRSLDVAYRSWIMVDGKVAGIVALEYPTLPRAKYQINIVLGRDYWDRVIATEALYQAVKIGLDALNLDGMFTKTESDNHVMTQVMESVGFQKTMVWREHVLKDGTYSDLLHWTIFRGADLPTRNHEIDREVRLERFPSPESYSPIDLFDDYPFTGDAPDTNEYVATEKYYRFWGTNRFMPESKKKLERGYPFTILADGEIVGDIGIGDATECRTTYEVGYAIGRPFWNKGICTEALKQVVRFGFDELKIHKIRCDTSAGNPASIRALEKAGFIEEEKNKAGLYEDSWFAQTVYVYIINPAESENRRATGE